MSIGFILSLFIFLAFLRKDLYISIKILILISMSDKKVLLSVYISNAFEFFDYTLFASLSVLIQNEFFPETLSTSSTIMTFCLSLIFRPLGSLLFGYIGDKISRTLSLKLSVFLMSCASLIPTISPTFSDVGIFATVLIITSRILQGISAGGEYNAAAIFAIENTKFSKHIISGFLTSSAIMGLVIAIIVSNILTLPCMPTNIWKIGFLFGSSFGFVSLFLRRNMKNKKPHNQNTSTQKQLVKPFFIIFLISGQTGAVSYFTFVGLKLFLISYSIVLTSLDVLSCLLIASFTCIITGFASAKIEKYSYQILGLILTGFIFPCAIYLTIIDIINSNILMVVSGLCLGIHGSQQHALFQDIITQQSIRQRLISLSFSLGTGIITTIILLLFSNNNKINLLSFFIVSILGLSLLLKREKTNENIVHY